MPLDITKIFKANVKAVRIGLSDDVRTELANEELLGKSKSKLNKNLSNNQTSVIAKEARLIIKNISVLKNFLLENKKEYVDQNFIFEHKNENTDWKSYEDQTESIIKKSADAIRQLKGKASSTFLNDQYKEHLENMFYSIEKYLKDVCKIYTEQKAIRVKRLCEKNNITQLCSSDLKKHKKVQEIDQVTNDEIIQAEYKQNDSLLFNELTEQELATLENENSLLYEDLNSQMNEVKKIESEVIEVSRLTQIFAENIVSQLQTIETIHSSAIETTSNLTTGNENIKEAMKKNAALRLWILFIIVVLSFTLLFLDWYNE